VLRRKLIELEEKLTLSPAEVVVKSPLKTSFQRDRAGRPGLERTDAARGEREPESCR